MSSIFFNTNSSGMNTGAADDFDIAPPRTMADLMVTLGDATPMHAAPRGNAAVVPDPASFVRVGGPMKPEDEDLLELPPPPDMTAADDPLTEQEKSNLYVSNISTDVSDEEFRAMFVGFGQVFNSRIMVDIHTCKSRGFGFVQFSNPAEAARAVRAMDGTVHRSQTLMVRLASRKTRQPGQLTSKMFVRNVPAGITEDEIWRYCSRFGVVQNCAVRPDVQHGVVTDSTTGGVSQVAYITFAEVDSAKRAAGALNNSKPWTSCVHPLLAKVLDSNQKRRGKDDEGTPGGLGGSASSSAAARNGFMESPGFSDSSARPMAGSGTRTAPSMVSPPGAGGALPAAHATGSPIASGSGHTMMAMHQGSVGLQHSQLGVQQSPLQQQIYQLQQQQQQMQQQSNANYAAAAIAAAAAAAASGHPISQQALIAATLAAAAVTSQQQQQQHQAAAPPMTSGPAGYGPPSGYQIVMQPTLQPMYGGNMLPPPPMSLLPGGGGGMPAAGLQMYASPSAGGFAQTTSPSAFMTGSPQTFGSGSGSQTTTLQQFPMHAQYPSHAAPQPWAMQQNPGFTLGPIPGSFPAPPAGLPVVTVGHQAQQQRTVRHNPFAGAGQ